MMNRVASVCGHKWLLIGLQLDIPYSQLRSIEARHRHGDDLSCYNDVFDVWMSRRNPPYTWDTILKVLGSPAIGERALMAEIDKWLEAG